ncbi:MAG TPA: FG-GAP repeat protein [Blastocatellia bacterium]|nr:FG-GAP repeat protein [Blastocatellia bacterium]
MRAWIAGLASAVLLTAAVSTFAQANRIQQSEMILQPAGDVVEHDTFGCAAAISGNTMVIGGFNADGVQVGAGAAFIFERKGNAWVQTARIFASDGRAEPVGDGQLRSDSFGSNVAISEDAKTVVVGAPAHTHPGLQKNAGAIYVFQRVGDDWVQQAELFSPTPMAETFLGAEPGFGGLAISGNTIAAGDEGTFNVDFFTRVNDTWTSSGTVTVPDDFAFVPSDVSLSGNTLVVGSTGTDSPLAVGSGAVYVFQRAEGTWVQKATLTAADATAFATFGFTVRINRDLVAIGANSALGATSQSGAAYVFANEDGAWSQQAKLIASDGMDFDQFGESVAIDGHTVLVGATQHIPAATGSRSGSAYVFQARDGNWTQSAELVASDAVPGGFFGSAVAVFNNTLVVGADEQHPPVEGYAGGEAYVFKLNP